MMRGATILWAMLATVAGTGLFLLKYEVQTQEEHLRNLRRDIVETEESIHVLKAEWSYLNEPLRLREEAERHLGLHPLKPSQIVASIDSLPMAALPPVASGQPEAHPAPAAAPMAPPTGSVEARPAKAHRQPHPSPAIKPLPAERSITARGTYSAPQVKLADTAKPVAAKAVPASAPAYRPIPASLPTPVAVSGNVMVITSPALSESEVASTRSRR